MSLRRRLPNPTLAALHPDVLPGRVERVLLVGNWSPDAAGLLATLRHGLRDPLVWLLTPSSIPAPGGIAAVWEGTVADEQTRRLARDARLDLVVPLEPYDLLGSTRIDLERFALSVGARAVAVHETTYGTVRIATRPHLRYRVSFRPWACRFFAGLTLRGVVAPLYAVYWVARHLGLWRGPSHAEDRL
jgi:hypothetical protein